LKTSESGSFFEKKEPKKRLLLARAGVTRVVQSRKVFLLLFVHKKNSLACSCPS
jgi:hypothetical protein